MKEYLDNNSKRKTGLVRVRGGFSDTNGISTCNTVMQVTEFDDATRVQISNTLFNSISLIFENENNFFHINKVNTLNIRYLFCKDIIGEVFCESNIYDSQNEYTLRGIIERINDVIFHAAYNEVLDVVFYCCKWFYNMLDEYKDFVIEDINRVFTDEYVGYRYVSGHIIPITNEKEIESIESACNNPFDGCRKQMQKAVGFLADRQNKDYKNCIKESISAVESICQIIVGDDNATLSDALKQLEAKGTAIHPALKQGFHKLYAYTCDKGGIRHAEGMFESNVTFEEAKFMLVSCSAFINYLIAEFGKGSK